MVCVNLLDFYDFWLFLCEFSYIGLWCGDFGGGRGIKLG